MSAKEARTSRRHKRNWWQVALRAAALVVLVLAGAYVTLPWWLPTGLLRRYLAAEMSRQMDVDVQIRDLSVSWSKGAQITGLTIGSTPGTGPEAMVRIETLSMDFSPVDIFVHKRIEWMELSQALYSVRYGADGQPNISRLGRLEFGAKPRRITQREGVATISIPDRNVRLSLEIRDLQIFPRKDDGIERLTMAAWLRQRGGDAPADGAEPACGDAPVSVHFTSRPVGSGAAARASLNFTNLDLGELGLKDALGLALDRLEGRCDGSLDLEMSRKLKVDYLRAELGIRDLNVQPLGGRELPPIKQAGFSISGEVDLLHRADTIKADLKSAAVRLPGIDLKDLQLSMEVPVGDVPQIRLLEFAGRIYPGRLAALLRERDQSTDGLDFDGPINIEWLRIERKGPSVAIAIVADATGAELSRGGEVIKPKTKKLRIDLQGALDERKWDLSITKNRLEFGRNWIEHKGRLPDIRPFFESLLKGNALPLGPALGHLSATRSSGKLHLEELDTLAAVAPSLAGALDHVELRGPVDCEWEVNGAGGHGGAAFGLDISATAGTTLAFRPLFAKPVDKKLKVEIDGRIVPRGPSPTRGRDVDLTFQRLDLTVGSGHLHTDGAQIRLRGGAGAATSVTMEAAGRFDISDTQPLVALSPGLADLGKVLAGKIRNGSYRITPGAGKHDVEISADLTDAGINFSRFFVKPKRQRAQVDLSFTWYETGESREPPQLDLAASIFPPQRAETTGGDAAPVEVAARIRFGDAADDKLFESCRTSIKLEGVDAAWLARSCPLLADRLDAERLEGSKVSGSAFIDIDKNGAMTASVDRKQPLMFGIGESLVTIAGSACLTPAGPSGPPRPADAPLRLEEFDVRLAGRLTLDDRLRRLVPPLASFSEKYGAEGKVEFAADIRGDGEYITLTSANINAQDLSIEQAGRFAKPAGMPAAAELSGSIDTELSDLRLKGLTGRIGDVSLRAEGLASLQGTPRDGQIDLRDWHLRLAASSDNAETLKDLLPRLGKWNLEGKASLEIELTNAGQYVAHKAEIAADRLAGRYGDTRFGLHGRVSIEGLRVRKGLLPVIGRVRTDGLEARIGDSHAWIVADVERFPNGPTGSVSILGRYVDDKELMDSASKLIDALQKEHQRPEATEEAEKTEHRTKRIIAQMRQWFNAANLKVRVSLGHLRKYDECVGQSYDIRRFELDASVVAGKLNISYTGGLNGGQAGGLFLCDLNEPVPRVEARSEFKDIIATESIQPQLTKYFPGNRVDGYFNRSEEVTFPLRDIVAASIDDSCRIRSTGKARTVTIGGTVVGRAAPQFISDIFPGLNLATYRYKTMTGFADIGEDGSAENDMIFDGRFYDLYITGTTDVENLGRYQVGVILLAAPQSPEWNHTYRLGRIPLLNFDARIEGGKMHDVKISYLRPDEIVSAILLTNNPLYRVVFGE